MTLASEARDSVRARPFLHQALRAGVVNYTAAARYLDIGDQETVATALRRYAEELSEPSEEIGEVRVDMRSGLGEVDTGDALLSVGDMRLAPGGGDLTGVIASGEFTVDALTEVLGRLAVEQIQVAGAGGCDGHLVIVVPNRHGVDALRYTEDALTK